MIKFQILRGAILDYQGGAGASEKCLGETEKEETHREGQVKTEE